jgi:alkylation response protein AidB-like acyl-CoA dehydrogenase
VQGLGRHGSEELRRRFLPGMINGTERWCQEFSEPGAGSDLAALRTTATRDSDKDDGDKDGPRHRGLSGFVISMHQPGIEQRPLRMINGVTNEFGQVLFDCVRVPADHW